MFIIMVAAIIMMAGAPASASSDTPAAKPAAHHQRQQVRCEDARRAVPYYRAITYRWQQARGGELADRTPLIRHRPCHWVRYAAHEWSARAHAARVTTQRYLRQRARERANPRLIAFRLLGYDQAKLDCLTYITDRENKRMDPTLNYGGGHGDASVAYGIPQAYPGYKMASAGPDWRTNPETQLRWMIAYCEARYGSVCGAAYSRRVYGMY